MGAPLTPEGLNNGKFNCDQPGGCTKSNFPEYHHVYIEQKNVDAYLKTGDFPEGTVIVKELTRVLNPTFPDGSRKEPSGRGYFNGAYNGIDMSIKDSKRFERRTAGVSSPLGIIHCHTRRPPRKGLRPSAPDAISPMSRTQT